MRDTVAHFLAKMKKVSQKELRMPQNINALLCFAEQYEVMKNEIIQTGRFGLDGESLMNLFAYWIGGAANSSS